MLKIKEAFMSVFPITAIVFLLIFAFIPTPTTLKVNLCICSVLLLVGIALFSLGADESMLDFGNGIGSALSKKNKLWLMLIASFAIGFIITFAEPDLMVLAKQVQECSSLNSVWVFIIAVSAGVGLLLTLGILRLYFKFKFSTLVAIAYGIVFLLSFFVPKSFLPIAYDAGSVTTGPISVPFLIAFGLGFSAVRSGQHEDDSFGLIALSSVGPIISVMVLSCFLQAEGTATTTHVVNGILPEMLTSLKDVAIVMLPIIALFAIFQIFVFKYPKTKVVRTLFGFFLVYIGIVLFLTGVDCAYLPLGIEIGQYLNTLDNKLIAVPIGLLLGAFAIIAEPALHVLKKQVEDITSKALGQKVIVVTISIGVAIAVGLAVLRAIHNFNLLFILIPLYVISVGLAFFNTKVFTAVAFDSGGVATGTMAVSFILPMVSGLSVAGNGFGTVALIAGFPVLTMQILGAIYKLKLITTNRLKVPKVYDRNFIVEFDYKKPYAAKEIKQLVVEFDYKKERK